MRSFVAIAIQIVGAGGGCDGCAGLLLVAACTILPRLLQSNGACARAVVVSHSGPERGAVCSIDGLKAVHVNVLMTDDGLGRRKRALQTQGWRNGEAAGHGLKGGGGESRAARLRERCGIPAGGGGGGRRQCHADRLREDGGEPGRSLVAHDAGKLHRGGRVRCVAG